MRSRLVSRRTATINQIRSFLIEQGIAVRVGPRALRKSLFAILENRRDEISPRMTRLILGLYNDWCHLDERIEAVTGEIEELSHIEPKCQRLMSVPGVGPLISTALVAAIDSGEAFDRGRDRAAWVGLVPRQKQLDLVRLWAPVPHTREPASTDQAALRRAIRRQQKVKFVYSDMREKSTERLVWPLITAFYGTYWYLAAWCEDRNGFRVFRLDRISNLIVLDTTFEREPGRTAEDFLKQDTAQRRPN